MFNVLEIRSQQRDEREEQRAGSVMRVSTRRCNRLWLRLHAGNKCALF